jgi:hypothetical protein
LLLQIVRSSEGKFRHKTDAPAAEFPNTLPHRLPSPPTSVVSGTLPDPASLQENGPIQRRQLTQFLTHRRAEGVKFVVEPMS